MKKVAIVFFNIACIISCVVALVHFTVPYTTKWFSYIPDAPIEIIQSINYVNFCFSFLLAGISFLLLITQKKLFDGSGELRLFYVFFTLTWASRLIIQLVWSWPTGLQIWLVVAFSMELLFTLIPMIYFLGNNSKHE